MSLISTSRLVRLGFDCVGGGEEGGKEGGGRREEGLRCALPAREDLEGLMAAEM